MKKLGKAKYHVNATKRSILCFVSFSMSLAFMLLTISGCSEQQSAVGKLQHSSADLPIIVIAEHRAARLDVLREKRSFIEQELDIRLKIVEYPAPAKDYFTKLVTELRSGNAPDVFSVPRDLQLDDLAAAGYLADLSPAMNAWEGYQHLPPLIKRLSQGSFDQRHYVVPSIVAVEQLYYRRDLLSEYGIETSQPNTIEDLLERAKQIKRKTGHYALLFPAGLTWGMGSFTEGYRYLLAAQDNYELLNDSGEYDLAAPAIVKAFSFYEELVRDELMPVIPLLNPEPWVIPKYEMFPKGTLMITTCGTWCKVFDWGPNSRNPIANIDSAVATWKIPAQNGEPFVLASLVYSWAVNDKSRRKADAIRLAILMGDTDIAISYAKRLGNVPARMDASVHPDFHLLGGIGNAHALLPEARAVTTTVGSSALMAGVARATEALLTERVDAQGAQLMLHDYVSAVLGEQYVQGDSL